MGSVVTEVAFGEGVSTLFSTMGAGASRRKVAAEAPDQTEEPMRYTCDCDLWHKHESGEVALLRGAWLIELHRKRWILPCRQELPPEALAKTPQSAEEEYQRKIVSLSYPWLTPQHPDPEGFHLHTLGALLRAGRGMDEEQRAGEAHRPVPGHLAAASLLLV